MIKPLNFYVAVKPIETKEVKTASGITLVSSKSNSVPTGRIVVVYHSSYGEIGIDDVKVGDVVAYKTGIEVKDGDEVYTLVNEKDLIAILSGGGIMNKSACEFVYKSEKTPDFAKHLKPTFAEEVHEVLEKIEKLFAGKNEQYRTENDDLANFTKGAMLRYGKADMPARFEALKDYVEKHIAKVYNSKLDDDKIDESIMDIAVYFVIAMVMHKRMVEERG